MRLRHDEGFFFFFSPLGEICAPQAADVQKNSYCYDNNYTVRRLPDNKYKFKSWTQLEHYTVTVQQ